MKNLREVIPRNLEALRDLTDPIGAILRNLSEKKRRL